MLQLITVSAAVTISDKARPQARVAQNPGNKPCLVKIGNPFQRKTITKYKTIHDRQFDMT